MNQTAWTLALLMTAGTMAHAAPASENRAQQSGAMTSSAHINFRIVIPVVMRISHLVQPDNVTIEQRHLEQGFIDLDSATSLRLTTNARRGSNLAVAFDPTWVSRVVVRAKGREHEVSGVGGTDPLTMERSTDELLQFGFRLYLRGTATSGNHRWPVSLTITPRAI